MLGAGKENDHEQVAEKDLKANQCVGESKSRTDAAVRFIGYYYPYGAGKSLIQDFDYHPDVGVCIRGGYLARIDVGNP